MDQGVYLDGNRFISPEEFLPQSGKEDLDTGTIPVRSMLDPGDQGLVQQLDKRMREKSPHSPPSNIAHSSETRDDRPSDFHSPVKHEDPNQLQKDAVKLALAIIKWAVFDGNSMLGPSVVGETRMGGPESYTPETQFAENASRNVDDSTELGRKLKREEIIPPTGRGSGSRGNEEDHWTKSLLNSFRVIETPGPAHYSPFKAAMTIPAEPVVEPLDENDLAQMRDKDVGFRNYGKVQRGPGTSMDDGYTPPNVLRGEVPPSVERAQPPREKVSFLLSLFPEKLLDKLT